MVGSAYSSAVFKKYQANLLALSGINIALSKLNKHPDLIDWKTFLQLLRNDEQPKEAVAENEKLERLQNWFLDIFSNLNKYQDFKLSSDVEGVDGEISICLSSEDGKLNINKIFDFDKKQFREDFLTILDSLKIEGRLKPGEFRKVLEAYMALRGYPLNDISELYDMLAFERVDMYYLPPFLNDRGESVSISVLALGDIFTTYSESEFLNPVFLTDSLCSLLGLRRPRADDAKVLQDVYKKIASDFNEKFCSDLATMWEKVTTVLGPFNDMLKKNEKIFSKDFTYSTFSLISKGKVGSITSTLVAYLKIVDISDEIEQGRSQNNADQGHGRKTGEKKTDAGNRNYSAFRVVKIVWLA